MTFLTAMLAVALVVLGAGIADYYLPPRQRGRI
jgi:hypothetical protein